MATLTFELEDDLARRLEEAAREYHLAPEDLMRQLVWAHLASRQPEDHPDAQLLRDIQAGFDDSKAGRVFTNEEVEAFFAARRAETQRNIGEEFLKSSGRTQP
ncbi:hypothetical protein [Pedomonas sp. V897]|uniref:hypothetical protein n=1 Tax=Pedomonas sp. V897 TaxID=3446482 RepID=UPI003EE08393